MGYLNEEWERVDNFFPFLDAEYIPHLFYLIIISLILWAWVKRNVLWAAYKRDVKFFIKFLVEVLGVFVVILTLIAYVHTLREATFYNANLQGAADFR